MAASLLKQSAWSGYIFRSLSSKTGLIRNGPSLKDFISVGESKISLDNHVGRVPYLAGFESDGRGRKGLSLYIHSEITWVTVSIIIQDC